MTISAVGDISFHGRYRDTPAIKVFDAVRSKFIGSDLVIGNLESPLVRSENPVPNKCTLAGSLGWSAIMREAGFNLLSLANNHIMDHGEEGLRDTLSCLKEQGIPTVGAGRNIEEAQAPLFLDIKGRRIAVIARSSVIVSSPNYASGNRPGAAFLDPRETSETIRACGKVAGKVILLIHWGLEDYVYPSPEQRAQAAEFVRSGADIIIGHHPHVLQGIESMSGSLIVYSLGNFLFDEFEWDPRDGENPTRVSSRLSQANRESMVIRIFSEGGKTDRFEPIFTTLREDSCVDIDSSEDRSVKLKKLSDFPRAGFFRAFWHVYAAKREWSIRLRTRLSPTYIFRNIYKVRPRHVRELFSAVGRSLKIVTGRSTNPYE